VRNRPYSLIYESNPVRICESNPFGKYPAGSEAHRWEEAELSQIRLVLRKLTSLRVGNPEDAEDLVQETMLTMVRKAPDIDIEKGLLIWAMGVLRRKVGNYYRRTQRCVPLEDHRLAARPSGACTTSTLSPELNLHHAELKTTVDALILKLSPQEREAVDLYLAGLQTSEIASRLQPERYQNIVNRLHRGRKKLARELSRLGYGRRPDGPPG